MMEHNKGDGFCCQQDELSKICFEVSFKFNLHEINFNFIKVWSIMKLQYFK